MAAETAGNLQQILDDSLATAGPAIVATFGPADRRLSAEELRQFWQSTRMFAVATVGKGGLPHIAPVHVQMTDSGGLEMAIFADSVRLRDLRRNPHIAITSWADDGRIAIVYGQALEVEGSRRAINPGSNLQQPREIITMSIAIDRAYAMIPRRTATS
jgi:hypothetical protein